MLYGYGKETIEFTIAANPPADIDCFYDKINSTEKNITDITVISDIEFRQKIILKVLFYYTCIYYI